MYRNPMSQSRLDLQDRRDGRRWGRIHSGSVVARRCPRCQEELTGNAELGLSCPRGHGTFKSTGLSVPSKDVREVYRAYETAQLAEEYLPESVERLMVALRKCRCGGAYISSGGCDSCERYVPAASVTDAALAVRMLSGLARHEVKLDRSMGVAGTEEKDPIVAGLIAAGITLDAFKRMSVSERAEKLREVRVVSEVVETPKLSGSVEVSDEGAN